MLPFDVRDVRAMTRPAIFSRGRTYFREGRVSQVFWDGRRIYAQVRGTRDYYVQVEAQGDRLLPSCTCPTEGVCKHAVAAMLHAINRGVQEVPDLDTVIMSIPCEDLRSLVANLAVEEDVAFKVISGYASIHPPDAGEIVHDLARGIIRSWEIRNVLDSCDLNEAQLYGLVSALLDLSQSEEVPPDLVEEALKVLARVSSADAKSVKKMTSLAEEHPDFAPEVIRSMRYLARSREAVEAILTWAEDATFVGDQSLTIGDELLVLRIHAYRNVGDARSIRDLLGEERSAEVISDACCALAEMGCIDEAVEICKGSLERRTERELALLYRTLARLHAMAGDRSGEIKYLIRTAEHLPDHGILHRILTIGDSKEISDLIQAMRGREILLLEAFAEKGMDEMMTEVALASDDLDVLEWAAEHLHERENLSPLIIKRLILLLARESTHEAYEKISYYLELLASHTDQAEEMACDLLKRYPRRPALKRLLRRFIS